MSVPRFIIYTRQSITKGEAGESLSLVFQERELRELVAKNGGIVLEPVIVDADEKGWDANRPGIAKLIERTERERPDGIAVYAVSRFARDSWLAEGIWRRLIAIQPSLIFLSKTEPQADDDLVRGILGVMSQAERKRMGAFLRSSFRQRALNGKPHGKPPFGYAKGEDGRLVVVPENAEWIRQILERFEEGWSLWRISLWLTEQDAAGRKWDPARLRIIIKSPALAGGIKCGDVLQWGCHEPIITREHHERLASALQGRRYIRTKKFHSWLERSMHCICGAPMDLTGKNANRPYATFRCAAVPSIGGYSRRRGWPPCSVHPNSMSQWKAERYTIEALQTALANIAHWQAVEKRLLAIYRENDKNGAARRNALRQEMKQLTAERERLLLLYRKAKLDEERWGDGDRELGERIEEIHTELASAAEPPAGQELRARAEQLQSMAEAIGVIAVSDPAQIGSIMRDAEISVQVIPNGIKIRWPERLAMFFEM